MNIVRLRPSGRGLFLMQRDDSRMTLDLLESIERDGNRSQRARALECGVALGLVNAYLKYCAKKGYIKIKRIPARRYIYYLTPKGLAEKSRLTLLHLSSVLSFFRAARRDCVLALDEAKTRDWRRVALAGSSELAEICMICALDHNIAIVALVDPDLKTSRFLGLPVVHHYDRIKNTVDGVIVTDIANPSNVRKEAIAAMSARRVITPMLLSSAASEHGAAA